MTTVTGVEEQKFKGSGTPPSFTKSILGSLAQIGIIHYVWSEYAGVTQARLFEILNCPVAGEGKSSCMELVYSETWCVAVVANLLIAALVFCLSITFRLADGSPNTGIIDQVWSIVPWANAIGIHCTTISESKPFGSERTLLMSALAVLWGARLTWNFWRKGGYSGGEDYRWVEVKKWMGGALQLEIFNFVFICWYQMLLLLAIAGSTVIAAKAQDVPVGTADYVVSAVFLMLLVGETVADIQMFNFQTEKYRLKREGKTLGPTYEKGFITSGLWSLSRHPNYFCEVHIWWSFYFFGVCATGEMVNWTIVGPILLNALFAVPGASLDITEMLSSRKYKAFPKYQATVPRFYPFYK
eukprot:m.35468 g.35468  ORF g.35468 m.35468 type:complete len:355 (-) comp17144_c0_seq1:234-1298(-)